VLSQSHIEPAHAQNQVFTAVLNEGLIVGGQTFKLPPPRLFDGQSAEDQRKALVKIAGGDARLDEMFHDSITALHFMDVRDDKAPGATIREAALWFAVYADLPDVDPAQDAKRDDQKEFSKANMRFQARILKEAEIRAAGVRPAETSADQKSWYARVHAKLLSRIDFEITNRIVISRSSDSIVVASRTDPAFSHTAPLANDWHATDANAPEADSSAARKPYAGGISYTKIARSALKPGALVVELHFAFVEPDEWFDTEPILRSKFSVIAQDQIRSLRQELAKKRKR
jgi:hypothetical protein